MSRHSKNLAKSDLAFYYRQCLDRVDEIIRLAFNRFNDDNVSEKDKSAMLRLLLDATSAQFELYNKGPEMLSIKTLDSRLSQIEANQQQQQANGR